MFRIFHEILFFEWETGRRADIAYMIDQSHNLKGKIEEMIQTVTWRRNSTRRRRWWITAWLPPRQACDLVRAEACCRTLSPPMFGPLIREWRKYKGLPQDPMKAFRESGYLERTHSNAPQETGRARSYSLRECGTN